MRATKLLSIIFIAGTLTLGLTVSQSVFADHTGGPYGDPHDADIPPGNPHIVGPGLPNTTGNPHEDDAPPGPGDPHDVGKKGNPHDEITPGVFTTGNPHDDDPRPHTPRSINANPNAPGEGPSSASHGEPTFASFPGERVANTFPGEGVSNGFPGEAFSNTYPGEA